MSADPSEALGQYRTLRQSLEEAILPLATSTDGRRFSFQASLHGLELRTGGYVVLGEQERMGQIASVELMRVDGPELSFPGTGGAMEGTGRITLRVAFGEGVMLDEGSSPFHDAEIRPATPQRVAAWLDAVRPPYRNLDIGELMLAPPVPATLDPRGFGRHTFLCGQSGSGKTYSLGLILEQLVLETDLRIVVLDPNSDYVRLGVTRPDVDPELASRYAKAAEGIVVRRGSDAVAGPERLRLRLSELEPAARAAVLRLDPVADRDEYGELVPLIEESQLELVEVDALAKSDNEHVRALAARARNLGVDRWLLWARSDAGSLIEELEVDPPRCLVIDLGSLATRGEQKVVAEATLASLWRNRERREPVLIVIDEAHNVCPAEPGDPLAVLASEHAARIAAEGRKYGLHLLVATQRPQKVNQEVLSQCDNVVLLRMNSPADLAFLGETLSFLPPGVTRLAATFHQGEALVAGRISPHPALVRFGRRLSQEGGSDVKADWVNA